MSTQLTHGLSRTELDQLSDAETVIKRDLKSFERVAAALVAIRDGKLYREFHATFEDYCAVKWGFTVRRAYQMIENAGTAKQLAAAGIETANEAQVAALAKVPPAKLAEVAAAVKAKGRITAKAIKAAMLESEPRKADVEQVTSGTPEVAQVSDGSHDSTDAADAACKKIARLEMVERVKRDFLKTVADFSDMLSEDDEPVDLLPFYEDAFYIFNETLANILPAHKAEVSGSLKKLVVKINAKLQ